MAPPTVELADREGSSSPTTPPPQSSFRELDDAFLQNQTRIWLGEVLNMRFDKDINISDLLADGQILYGVYKVFRKMLLSEDHSIHQKFLEREYVSSSEITRKFPYAVVACFLEVCKHLGLSDIDLFTPSDVVDKGNTRKVCMCLRSLSKKAKSRNLNVPDFDSVTVTHRKKSPVNMPTDMVGNRRRNLERASSSPINFSDDMRTGSKRSQQQGEFVSFHSDNSAYKSGDGDDDDDDCESKSVIDDFLGGFTDSSANSTSPKTPDPSTVGDFSFVQAELEQLEIEGPDGDENEETTSPSQDLGSGMGDNFELIDCQSIHDRENNLPNHSPILVDWQALVEESEGNNAVKSDDMTADIETHLNRDDCFSHIQLVNGENADLQLEVSTNDVEAIESPSPDAVDWQALMEESEGNNTVKSDDITADSETESNEDNCFSHTQLVNGENADLQLEVVSTNDVDAIEPPSPVAVDMNSFPSKESRQEFHDVVGIAETSLQEVILNDENCRDIPCMEDIKEMRNPSNPQYGNGDVVSNGGLEIFEKDKNDHHVIENADKSQIVKDEIDDSKDENKKIAQQSKPPRKMLKLIAGGTGTVAAVGVMLYWLQLRKKGTENAAAQKFSLPIPKKVAATSDKQERASTNKVYPANKLKF